MKNPAGFPEEGRLATSCKGMANASLLLALVSLLSQVGIASAQSAPSTLNENCLNLECQFLHSYLTCSQSGFASKAYFDDDCAAYLLGYTKGCPQFPQDLTNSEYKCLGQYGAWAKETGGSINPST
jgi:hypothetical protein